MGFVIPVRFFIKFRVYDHRVVQFRVSDKGLRVLGFQAWGSGFSGFRLEADALKFKTCRALGIRFLGESASQVTFRFHLDCLEVHG